MVFCRSEGITGLRIDGSSQKEPKEKERVFSPINTKGIAQDTPIDRFAINQRLATRTPGSIRIYPCYAL